MQIYLKNVHPKFPDGGKMSQYMESLSIGDYLDIRGPSGLLIYEGLGEHSLYDFGIDFNLLFCIELLSKILEWNPMKRKNPTWKIGLRYFYYQNTNDFISKN